MNKIGEYEYPNLGTFRDALSLAEDAIKKYGGIIPNMNAAQKLGYTVKDSTSISGTIYKRINDLCMFGLFTRERGGLKATPLAEEALDPYDSTKATEGRARAVRNIKLVERVFDAWKGEIPDETAFPAKLAEITGISWTEAQRHTESVRNLIVEAFDYLKPSAALPKPIVEQAARGEPAIGKPIAQTTTVTQAYGEIRSTLGTIVVKDKRTWKIAKDLLYALGEQLGLSEEDMK